MSGADVFNDDLTPSNRSRNQKRGGFNSVGDNVMVRSGQRLNAFDSQKRSSQPFNFRTHRVEKSSVISDLGFARC